MKTKYPMKLDKYYVYCPALPDKVLEKLRSTYWQRNQDSLPFKLHEIFSSSPKVAKDALEQLARNFKNDQGYDFSLYATAEHHDDERLSAFIWAEKCHNNDFVDNRAIGGACFRYRTDYAESEFNGWALQWVYLHPNHRRNGLLAKAWDYFKQRFGAFIVEDPFSTSMYFFLAKNGFPCKSQKDLYDDSPGPKGKLWRAIKSALEPSAVDV